jgi:hypothetical protein
MDGRVSIPGRGSDLFRFVTTSRSAAGPIQHIQWILGAKHFVHRQDKDQQGSLPSIKNVFIIRLWTEVQYKPVVGLVIFLSPSRHMLGY